MSKCYVIGGANIDIMGKSIGEMVPYDSNLANISLSYGGVGRNIAENISLNGIKVYFKSVFSSDVLGQLLYSKCLSDGFDLTYSEVIDDSNTSIYLAILNQANDMVMALNDMKILNFMDIDKLKIFIDNVKEEDWLVFDTNLDIKIIEYIVHNKHYKLALDPISVVKASKIKPYLKHIDFIKPNRYEAQTLVDKEIKSKEDYREALEAFKKIGIKEAIITLGEDGVIYFNQDGYYHLQVDESVNVVNATGAGDAFFGGYLASRIEFDSIDEAVKMGMSAAQLAMACADTVNKSISRECLLNEKEAIKWLKEEI